MIMKEKKLNLKQKDTSKRLPQQSTYTYLLQLHRAREDLPKTQPETVTEGGDDEVTNIDVTVNGADK